MSRRTKSPDVFAFEIRSLVERLSQPNVPVIERRITCARDADGKPLASKFQYTLYKYLRAVEMVESKDHAQAKRDVATFRQSYAISTEGDDFVLRPRSDMPMGRIAMELLAGIAATVPEDAPPEPTGDAIRAFLMSGEPGLVPDVLAPPAPPAEPTPAIETPAESAASPPVDPTDDPTATIAEAVTLYKDMSSKFGRGYALRACRDWLATHTNASVLLESVLAQVGVA
jgi:hypothetical protein